MQHCDGCNSHYNLVSQTASGERFAPCPGLPDEASLLFTYCLYCGERFEVSGKGDGDRAAQLVTLHIETCGKHPLGAERKLRVIVEERLERSLKALEGK